MRPPGSAGTGSALNPTARWQPPAHRSGLRAALNCFLLAPARVRSRRAGRPECTTKIVHRVLWIAVYSWASPLDGSGLASHIE